MQNGQARVMEIRLLFSEGYIVFGLVLHCTEPNLNKQTFLTSVLILHQILLHSEKQIQIKMILNPTLKKQHGHVYFKMSQ